MTAKWTVIVAFSHGFGSTPLAENLVSVLDTVYRSPVSPGDLIGLCSLGPGEGLSLHPKICHNFGYCDISKLMSPVETGDVSREESGNFFQRFINFLRQNKVWRIKLLRQGFPLACYVKLRVIDTEFCCAFA